jgi:hypothetical protein
MRSDVRLLRRLHREPSQVGAAAEEDLYQRIDAWYTAIMQVYPTAIIHAYKNTSRMYLV